MKLNSAKYISIDPWRKHLSTQIYSSLNYIVC